MLSLLLVWIRYIVVLMAQAKIYWNRENYQMVEKIFHKSLEVWCEDDTLRLNIAHVLFMQNKYKKAISFYEPIVKKHYDNVSVDGSVLQKSSSEPSLRSDAGVDCVQVEQCSIQECPCRSKPSVKPRTITFSAVSLACLTALLLVSLLVFDFEGFCVGLQWGYTLVMTCKVFTFHALQIKHWRTQTHLESHPGLCDPFHAGGRPHVCVSL